MPHHDLRAIVDGFSTTRLLCLGDVMLDRFIYGAVERISPEAPIPVMRVEREETMLGGAGNVVRNLVALGVSTRFVSVVGDDAVGRDVLGRLSREPHLTPLIVTEKHRHTPEKTRYVAHGQQMLRADRESNHPVSAATEAQIIAYAESEIPQVQAVILSDYAKGVLTENVIRAVMECAARTRVPVIVDPKARDFGRYQGATLLSPNLHELRTASGEALEDDEAIITAARAQLERHNFQHMLVTRGKDGMTLISRNAASVTHIPAEARDIFDVSGAGDTSIATLSAALAAGADFPEAARLANIAAGIVVGKPGTAVVQHDDLTHALTVHSMHATAHKISERGAAREQVERWRQAGQRVGFTNGCFDLLHPGHLALLHEARALCDRLVVAVNSDASVKRLKGPERPINNEVERALLLAALSAVDLVVIFSEDTPMALIEALKPEVLIKGSDYRKDQVVGADFVESYGGRVALVELKHGYSTTALIARVT